jgi:rhodanese-related sulfurtransferase
MVNQLRARDLAQLLKAAGPDQPVVLDVREPWEVQTVKLAGSVSIPMREVPARLAEIDPDRPIVCLCHHGMRSMQVANFLVQQGFASVQNLAGGIDAWSREVDPSLPTY